MYKLCVAKLLMLSCSVQVVCCDVIDVSLLNINGKFFFVGGVLRSLYV